jgi:hypothetical protein
VKTLRVAYHDVLQDAEPVARSVVAFLGIGLDVEAMARQVDGSLYRNREK